MMNILDVKKYAIEGPLLVNLKKFEDSRGFFVERFNLETFKRSELPHQFVQDNFSRSQPRVLRGLHYQHSPAQGKLVSCLRGRVLDVIVDIRAKSPTFGEHLTVELSEDLLQSFWIPAGFAHGFCVLGDQPAELWYKVDHLYSPKTEGTLLWNDSDLKIKWPSQDFILSDKDRVGGTFAEYRKTPVF